MLSAPSCVTVKCNNIVAHDWRLLFALVLEKQSAWTQYTQTRTHAHTHTHTHTHTQTGLWVQQSRKANLSDVSPLSYDCPPWPVTSLLSVLHSWANTTSTVCCQMHTASSPYLPHILPPTHTHAHTQFYIPIFPQVIQTNPDTHTHTFSPWTNAVNIIMESMQLWVNQDCVFGGACVCVCVCVCVHVGVCVW